MRFGLSMMMTLLTTAMILLSALRCECAAAGASSSATASAVCPCCAPERPAHTAPVHGALCLRCAGTLTMERLSTPDLRPAPTPMLCVLPLQSPALASPAATHIGDDAPHKDTSPRRGSTLLQLHCALTV